MFRCNCVYQFISIFFKKFFLKKKLAIIRDQFVLVYKHSIKIYTLFLYSSNKLEFLLPKKFTYE